MPLEIRQFRGWVGLFASREDVPTFLCYPLQLCIYMTSLFAIMFISFALKFTSPPHEIVWLPQKHIVNWELTRSLCTFEKNTIENPESNNHHSMKFIFILFYFILFLQIVEYDFGRHHVLSVVTFCVDSAYSACSISSAYFTSQRFPVGKGDGVGVC